MQNRYFQNIPEIEELKPERILFSFEQIPIVFVCTDCRLTRYLCICTDPLQGPSWMLVPISESDLLSVLRDRITVLHAFRISPADIIMVDCLDGVQTVRSVKYNEISPSELPSQDQYLEMQPYLTLYIAQLEKELSENKKQFNFKIYPEETPAKSVLTSPYLSAEAQLSFSVLQLSVPSAVSIPAQQIQLPHTGKVQFDYFLAADDSEDGQNLTITQNNNLCKAA